jgi:DNA-binding CsgD family transcriptional regulator
MKASKRLLVIECPVEEASHAALQLESCLQPLGFQVDSCGQPQRLNARLSVSPRYDLVLAPVSAAYGSDQLAELNSLIQKLRQQELTIPVLLLLMPGAPLATPRLVQLDNLLRLSAVDCWPMPTDPKLLALKCRALTRQAAPQRTVLPLPGPLGQAAQRLSGLSRRESEILQLMGEGLSNKEISQALTLSEHSVRTHVYHIFSKLGIKRRSQAVLLDLYHRMTTTG